MKEREKDFNIHTKKCLGKPGQCLLILCPNTFLTPVSLVLIPFGFFSGQVTCTYSPLYYQISGRIVNSVHFWETYIKMSSGALTERGRSNP